MRGVLMRRSGTRLGRRKRARQTLLKIRAVPLERMPKSLFFFLIRQATDTGVIDPRIRITTMNWDHAEGQHYDEGTTLSAKDREELRNAAAFLFGAVGKHDVRVERPDR